jgi:hypothetical protein
MEAVASLNENERSLRHGLWPFATRAFFRGDDDEWVRQNCERTALTALNSTAHEPFELVVSALLTVMMHGT